MSDIVLALRHATKLYAGVPAIEDVDFELRRGEIHAVLRNPYKFSGNHHAGNKMAMDNIRERLALHFDAEASLETRAGRDSYEVHIRMPYRPAVRVERVHA